MSHGGLTAKKVRGLLIAAVFPLAIGAVWMTRPNETIEDHLERGTYVNVIGDWRTDDRVREKLRYFASEDYFREASLKMGGAEAAYDRVIGATCALMLIEGPENYRFLIREYSRTVFVGDFTFLTHSAVLDVTNRNSAVSYALDTWDRSGRAERVALRRWIFSLRDRPIVVDIYDQWMTRCRSEFSVGSEPGESVFDPELIALYSWGRDLRPIYEDLDSEDPQRHEFAVRFLQGLVEENKGSDRVLDLANHAAQSHIESVAAAGLVACAEIDDYRTRVAEYVDRNADASGSEGYRQMQQNINHLRGPVDLAD